MAVAGAVRGADLQDAKAATARPALIPAHPDRPPRRMRAAYHIPQGWTSGPPLGKLRGDEAGVTTGQAMTTGHIHFGDSTRQAALFGTMILAAPADGSGDKGERQGSYRRRLWRPEV